MASPIWITLLIAILALKIQFSMTMSNAAFDNDNDSLANFTNGQLTSSTSLVTSRFRAWLNKTLATYDKRLRPGFGGNPLTIKLGLFLISISSFDENRKEFTVEMFFHEVWRDERLRFDAEAFGGRQILTMPLDAPFKFWIPDTSFLNALRSQTPLEGSVSHLHYMKLNSNGTIYYSRRLSVTAECPVDLTMYPFDQQACKLELSSYGSTMEDIMYEWSLVDDAIPIDKIDLPDFYATRYVARNTTRRYVAGEFSIPQLCIVLKRRSGFCFLQLFVPATAVVGSSWISLWLENETQFADMVAVILAIIFLSYSYNTVMPKVSYVKAMDIYLAACFIFAFVSLVKLAIVKHMHQVVNKRKSRRKSLALTSHMPMMQVTPLITSKSRPSIFNDQSALISPSADTCPSSSTGGQLNTPSNDTPIAIHFGIDEKVNQSDHHDSYWRCMKTFHIASQLIFPLAFIAFGIFYFFIYPNLPRRGGTCD